MKLYSENTYPNWGCRDRMVVGFSAYHQVVSLNPAHGEVYSMQLYVIDLFSLGTGIPPPIKLTTMIITKILLKVALNTITLLYSTLIYH